ncbi:MAG: GAF domain-containing sensor histidine kinase [Polyangiaceae bacterium]
MRKSVAENQSLTAVPNPAVEAVPQPPVSSHTQLSATERLVEVAQELSMARELADIMRIVRRAARDLTGADGATFVLRDGELCFYADEDAIGPLWKGKRFPLTACISGWSMMNREAAILEDIYADSRIPADAYRPTFVKSLAMVPIRTASPVGAIGNYWAERHRATEGEVKLLRALADLTSVAMENVQLYGELQKRIAEAQDALRAREEFITVAAHELKTPLTALQLQVENLEQITARGGTLPAEGVRNRITGAVSSVRRLVALVDGLLDVWRIRHDRLQLKVEPFDLVATVREVAARLAPSAERAGSPIDVKASSAVRGAWDCVRVEQLLMHLLSNAIKYGRSKSIEVVIAQHEGAARVEVRDHGPGIAPEVAGKIFERFGRAGPVTNYGGLGLGLYLSRQIVEAHGGTIDFHSTPGDGCTFVVELPLVAKH